MVNKVKATPCTSIPEILKFPKMEKVLKIINKQVDLVINNDSMNGIHQDGREWLGGSSIPEHLESYKKNYDFKEMSIVLKKIGNYNFSDITLNQLDDLDLFLIKIKNKQYGIRFLNENLKLKHKGNTDKFLNDLNKFILLFDNPGSINKYFKFNDTFITKIQYISEIIRYIKENNLEKDKNKINSLFKFFDRDNLLIDYEKEIKEIKQSEYPNNIKNILIRIINNNLLTFESILKKEYFGHFSEKNETIELFTENNIYNIKAIILSKNYKNFRSILKNSDGIDDIKKILTDIYNLQELSRQKIIDNYENIDIESLDEERKKIVKKIKKLEKETKFVLNKDEKIFKLKSSLLFYT